MTMPNVLLTGGMTGGVAMGVAMGGAMVSTKMAIGNSKVGARMG